MINVTCANCGQVLEIDEGFAGGVIRCTHCKTIQEVPGIARPRRRPAAPGAVADTTAQAPAGEPAAVPHDPETLQDLANYVQSSGLTGTGLTASAHRHVPAHPPAPAKPNRAKLFAIIAGAVVLIAAVAVGLKLWLDSRNPEPITQGGAGGGGAIDKPRPPSPNFAGIPLKGPSVIYLLDRGSGTINTYDTIIGGAIKSLKSLGPDRKFQIIFWETEELIAVPEKELKAATPENIKAAQEVMETVRAFSQSKIEASLAKAIAMNPSEIVIVTGKFGLDDDFVKAVMDKRGPHNIPIHTASMGRDGSPEALKKIADRTSGTFKEVTGSELDELLHP